MRGLRISTMVVAMSALAVGMPGVVQADDVPHGPVHWIHDHDWSGHSCRYPGPSAKKSGDILSAPLRVTKLMEVEPNDSPSNAQAVDLTPGPVNPVDVDIIGAVNVGADVDRYAFTAVKGDVYGLAVIGQGSLDSVVAIERSNGITLIENDNDGGFTYLYPPQSPFPGGVSVYDSSLTWIAPEDGDYLIRVSSFASASRGDYTLKIRARRPSFESQDLGSTQIIFVDFDGATFNAQEVFRYYAARSNANLSPLRSFLPRWLNNNVPLMPTDESEVVQAIIDVVQDSFDALRQASLNGNILTDHVRGHFDVQILNSRDHADPWGQPNVSRVIVGGTIDQLGIPTIGIASTIDPGNFSREDTGVVLLDYLSAPKGNLNSANTVGLAGGKTIFDAIGATVGGVVVHEAGHYLGNWHTDPHDAFRCVMDTGGVPIWFIAGAGPDGILGTGDDYTIEFTAAPFDPYEQVATGDQRTDVNTAFALGTGRVQREQPPEIIPPTYPLASVRATPTIGYPPLTVEFSAGAIDDSSDVSYVWDFKDGSPAASGPIVSHVFTTPGMFVVKVTATNSLNATGMATVLVTVKAPSPTAVILATPTKGNAPLTVSFDGSTSSTGSPDFTPLSYEWDFGDGTTSNEAVTEHTYTQAGYYAATLRFSDSGGGTSTANVLITVSGPGSVTNLNSAAQEKPGTSPVAPQCGLGGGVMMIGSFTGLFAMMLIRRRQ